MKISRHKKLRRYLSFYKNTYSFRSPLQILIDATFCQEALKFKVNLKDQVPKYLEDPELKMFTTACVIIEVESLGPKLFGASLVVKQFKIRRCGHEKNPISAADCLLSMVENGNQDHYIVATQDQILSEKCRKLPGVPLLYMKYNAIHMEKPSKMNIEELSLKSKAKLSGSDFYTESVKKLKKEMFGEEKTLKRKKKVKGPNPLSCKKKKHKSELKQHKTEPEQQMKKRKRKQRHRRSKNKSSLENVAQI